MRRPRLGTILLTVWAATLTVFVYAYIAWLQPSRLAGTVSDLLESTFKVHCDMGALSLTLLPMPTVTIDELSFRRSSSEHVEFHTRRARVQVSWFSLLRLKPIVRTVTLDSPTVDLSALLVKKTPAPSGSSAVSPLASFEVPDVPRYVTGLRIHIMNGSCRLISPDRKNRFLVSGIELSSRLPGLLPGSLELDIGSMRCMLASGIDLSAQGTKISVGSLYENTLSGEWSGEIQASTALQLESLDACMGRRISDPYRYFPMPEPLRFSLYAALNGTPEKGLYAAKGKSSVRALLPMNGHDVPISLDVPFQMEGLSHDIGIRGADVRMGDDRITIDGRLAGLAQGRPVLKGRADIHHFSLTRWFGFGRLMDPGLQYALDSITGEFEEFELSLKGVTVPRLKADVQGIKLAGSGSCTEFLKPVVRIDAHAQKADLNRVFTELKGHIPDLSHLPPPVLPLPKSTPSPAPSSGVTVGYDIHISADQADIMKFRVGGADVHVIPAPRYGTMLTIDVADVYGGKADSKVYIQDKIRVTADLSRVELGGPSAALAGHPVLNGLLKEGKVDISFLPGNGITMLTTLGGTVDAVMEKGNISVKGSAPVPYRRFTVDASAKAVSGKGARKLPPFVDFLGRWKAEFESDSWKIAVDAPKAALGFSTVYGLPCLIREQAMKLKLTLDKALLGKAPQALALTVEGNASYDAAKATLGVNNGSLRHEDFRATGSVLFSRIYTSPVASGRTTVFTDRLRKAVSVFGVSLPPTPEEHTFASAQLTGAYRFASDSFSLSELSGWVDGTHVTGHLKGNWASRTSLSGTLDADTIDLDRYLPKSSSEPSAQSAGTPLPLDFLRDTDLKLNLSADRLRVFSTDLSHVSVPVTQSAGTFTAPFHAAFPEGGSLSGHTKAVLLPESKQVSVSLQSRATQVNMLGLTQSRGQKTLISGMGNADTSLHSIQRCWEDWKHSLDGFLAFVISGGTIISPSTTSTGETSTSRTAFQSLSMSANVHDGLVSCRDFKLLDSLLDVRGEGSVDLAEQTIDAKATITVGGIPELPLTITGKLTDPVTSYKVLGAVTGTVGNIGSSLLNLVGSVISAPFKLITGKRILAPLY